MPVTAAPATTTKTTTSFNEKSKQAAGPDINGLLFTHSHIQSHLLTSVCEPYAVWNTLIITLNAWLSRSLTQAQTQAQPESEPDPVSHYESHFVSSLPQATNYPKVPHSLRLQWP